MQFWLQEVSVAVLCTANVISRDQILIFDVLTVDLFGVGS